MIDIERKHWEFYVENYKKEGALFLALNLFKRFEMGVEEDFDWEDNTVGPYRFYFQRRRNGWVSRYWKVPFSKARKWTP
jgi:hypothetical protein